MARPKVTDRATADETLTIRITSAERMALDELVIRRMAELEGTGATVTAAGLVRALIMREAKQVLGGIPAPSPAKPAPSNEVQAMVVDERQQTIFDIPAPTPTPTETNSAAKPARQPKPAPKLTLVERLKLVQEKGLKSFRQIGAGLGMTDGSAVGKWASGTRPIPAAMNDRLDKILSELGV